MVRWRPFIVYALDAPTFPPGEIWPYDPHPTGKRVRYRYSQRAGLLTRLSGQPAQRRELEGSLVVLSGGYHALTGAAEDREPEQMEVSVEGCLGMQDRMGDRFAERVLVEMLDPDARVTMVLYVSRNEATEHLAVVREAGLEVIVTGDVAPGVASNFAACRGQAWMLREYDWLLHVWPFEPFFFLANQGPESITERAIIDAAAERSNPEAAAVDLVKRVEQAPYTADEVWGQHYVRVDLTGPEMKSLLVARRKPDVSGLDDLFSTVAREIGVELYDAGSLRSADSEGRYFTEFPFWDRRMPVPEHWKIIV